VTRKGERTREKIIDKALQVFSVKGYFNTSVADLLEAAGLTKGGLYGHFRSKEEVWYAVYGEAVARWKAAVFAGARDIADPLARVEATIARVLRDYLAADLFAGGCFFVNMLVELTGQSGPMSRHVRRGFVGFSKLLQRWLQDAQGRGIIREGLPLREVADFIVITLNGAATFYMSTREPAVLEETLHQLRFYLRQLT
jgi:AcrR family transcriptional regulator